MLRLTGFTHEDRFRVAARVSEALGTAGGWILDHHQFSNLALCIRFEIARKRLPRLGAALANTGLDLSDDSREALADFSAIPGDGDDDISASIQVTFVHNEPDLRMPGPLLG